MPPYTAYDVTWNMCVDRVVVSRYYETRTTAQWAIQLELRKENTADSPPAKTPFAPRAGSNADTVMHETA